DKKTDDAHDNPVLSIDDKGYLWVFASAHGTSRPAWIFRSEKPYEIDAFRCIWKTNFSYPQPWFVEGQGFLFLHTRYQEGRMLHQMTSPDGVHWSEPLKIAGIEQGGYQVSWRFKNKVATAFNHHPRGKGVNFRTNLYYMETKDFGQTWTNAQGQKLDLPLVTIDNPALVRDYVAAGQLVYIQELNFDSRGNPVILYNTSRGWEPGPRHGLRNMTTARWVGNDWEITSLIATSNNYDTGCLHVEGPRLWRLIAPTMIGRDLPPSEPQPWGVGGEMIMWTSENLGRTWTPQPLTANSVYNHTFARRPVDANPAFYAFWADGDARKPSPSRLYFANQNGEVFRLPERMTDDFARPEPVPLTAQTHSGKP
ncbi:MAG TPA: BNR-4 repeat-containing protein, partial [Phycisphaerae bacterium]|nr:BNR-4 repeat-containing protein [Phycisphaerae bacterium]